MIKYYKLKLDDSIFWQSKVNQGKLTYDKKTYVPKCMNYVFFKQETDGTYTEIFQGHKFIIKDGTNAVVLVPEGVIINGDNFTPSSKLEITKAYAFLKNRKLMGEYMRTLIDFFVKTPLCEDALNKRQNAKKSIFSLRRKNN